MMAVPPQAADARLFVDQLPYHEPREGPSIETQLLQVVSDMKVGKVLRLIKKPGQGFGYLVFRDSRNVVAALAKLNGHQFMGRTLRVELPKGAKNGPKSSGERTEQPFTRQVLLSDLPRDQSPHVIREAIREYAPAIEARIELIKLAGGGRKAFLTFFSDADVAPAIDFLHGFKLLGRRVEAVAARPPGSSPFAQGNKDDAQNEEQLNKEKNLVSHAAIKLLEAANAKQKFAMPTLVSPEPFVPPVQSLKPGDCGSPVVVVGGLDEHTTVGALRDHFRSCGRIVDVQLIVNPGTFAPTGLAKVTYSTGTEAKEAKRRLDQSQFCGTVVRVGQEGDADVVLSSPDEDDREAEEDAVDDELYAREKYGVKNLSKFLSATSGKRTRAVPRAEDEPTKKEHRRQQKPRFMTKDSAPDVDDTKRVLRARKTSAM